MTKDLHKEIMKRSKLGNIFLKDKTATNRKKTKKLKGNLTKNFSKPLKNHTLTLSIRNKLPITGHFGIPFCFTLHKKCQKAKRVIPLKREMSYQVMNKFALLLTIFFKTVSNLNIPLLNILTKIYQIPTLS